MTISDSFLSLTGVDNEPAMAGLHPPVVEAISTGEILKLFCMQLKVNTTVAHLWGTDKMPVFSMQWAPIIQKQFYFNRLSFCFVFTFGLSG